MPIVVAGSESRKSVFFVSNFQHRQQATTYANMNNKEKKARKELCEKLRKIVQRNSEGILSCNRFFSGLFCQVLEFWEKENKPLAEINFDNLQDEATEFFCELWKKWNRATKREWEEEVQRILIADAMRKTTTEDNATPAEGEQKPR